MPPRQRVPYSRSARRQEYKTCGQPFDPAMLALGTSSKAMGFASTEPNPTRRVRWSTTCALTGNLTRGYVPLAGSSEAAAGAYGRDVLEPETSHRPRVDKRARQAARAVVASYHQQELGRLLDHVRDGFVRLDAGEIDEFDLDEVIHRYKRAAAKLWSFCGSSGGQWEQAANRLAFLRDSGEPSPDWWTEAAPRHRQ